MNSLSLLSFVSACFSLHIQSGPQKFEACIKDRYAVRSTITCILSIKKTIPQCQNFIMANSLIAY